MEGVIAKRDLIYIRDGVDEDRPFIFASWLKGLRFGCDYFELIESGSYYRNHHKVVESVLNDFEVTVRVACLRDDPSVILGYCVFKNDRLDWVFVKRRWRNIGIARDLLPKLVTVVSQITSVGRSLLRKHPGVKFDPYALQERETP